MSNNVTAEDKIAGIKDAVDLSDRIAEETWYSINLTMVLADLSASERASIRAIMDRAKEFRSQAMSRVAAKAVPSKGSNDQ